MDTVLCNPPYFKDRPQSVKNPNPHLAIARHELSANLDQILAVTSDLLKMNGKAYFVHRPERLDDLFSTMATNRLAPKRIRFVHPESTTGSEHGSDRNDQGWETQRCSNHATACRLS